MQTRIEVEKKTAERFAREEAKKTKRGATYVTHTEGKALCEALLPALAQFMVSEKAPSPHKGLKSIIFQLESEELALVALSPLLHQIAVGWKRGEKSALMKLKLSMGRTLHDKLLMKKLLTTNKRGYERARKGQLWKYREREWSASQYVRVGHWLLTCVLERLDDVFVLDQGVPCVTKEGEEFALALCAKCVYRNPAFRPTTEPLKAWTGWRAGGYWDDGTRISATFVRHAHPATQIAVRRLFRKSKGATPHIEGVNALQRVAWTINVQMLPVVERFAGEVGKKVSKLLVAEDIATAKKLGEKRFYVPMNCDFRGRIFGIPHFNFQREDHVRALFQFARGMPIGDDGLDWLMIHVANCGDFDRISKLPFPKRIAWAQNNKDRITRTAHDPAATLHWWGEADAPYSFVASCIELAAAWQAGPSYITHLPVCFDASCSGAQHLAMMMRDEDVGRLVNLTASGEPQDIYQVITDCVIGRLKAEAAAGDEKAKWWLGQIIDRKLIKKPAMTFAYSVTVAGMMGHLVEAYRERRANNEPTEANARYLAKHIKAAAEKVLQRPAKAMEFIRSLAKHCADKGKPLEWTSPTGFPWANRYCEPIVKVVHLECRNEYVPVRHRVGEGFKPGILPRKSMDAAAPNFVHSLDAAHLIGVVNAAASEGITDIVTVHDSFGCLAPQSRELRQIILTQFAELYSRDVLADLRDAAGSTEPLPNKGSLDPWGVIRSKYAFA